MGWQVKRTLDGRINGYHALMGHDPLVHAGTKLYKGDSVVYSDANDARSRSWEFGEKLYIADGRKGAAVLRRHGRDAGGRGRIHPHADHRARARTAAGRNMKTPI